jgi:hypothetical protein
MQMLAEWMSMQQHKGLEPALSRLATPATAFWVKEG